MTVKELILRPYNQAVFGNSIKVIRHDDNQLEFLSERKTMKQVRIEGFSLTPDEVKQLIEFATKKFEELK
jgi:uncharacterized tellurite resistance protein B-like protein